MPAAPSAATKAPRSALQTEQGRRLKVASLPYVTQPDFAATDECCRSALPAPLPATTLPFLLDTPPPVGCHTDIQSLGRNSSRRDVGARFSTRNAAHRRATSNAGRPLYPKPGWGPRSPKHPPPNQQARRRLPPVTSQTRQPLQLRHAGSSSLFCTWADLPIADQTETSPRYPQFPLSVARISDSFCVIRTRRALSHWKVAERPDEAPTIKGLSHRPTRCP